ncbi:MAG: hypothetical protein R3B54_18535 [Bdellovibrionota bacterium]
MARSAGAISGKLLGAGGGGFLCLFVKAKCAPKFRGFEALYPCARSDLRTPVARLFFTNQKRAGLNNAAVTQRHSHFVAGHKGLIGSAFLRRFEADGLQTCSPRHARLGLRDQAVLEYFPEEASQGGAPVCRAKWVASWKTGITPLSSSPRIWIFNSA